MISYLTQSILPIIVMGIFVLILLLILIFWSNIANPRLNGIVRNLEMKVSELTIDANRSEVTVKLKVRNNNLFSSPLLQSFSGGISRLDARIISRDIKLSSPVSVAFFKVRKPSNAEIWFVLEKPEYLDELRNKQENREQAYWQFDTSCKLNTMWGETVWSCTNIAHNEIPRIGNV